MLNVKFSSYKSTRTARTVGTNRSNLLLRYKNSTPANSRESSDRVGSSDRCILRFLHHPPVLNNYSLLSVPRSDQSFGCPPPHLHFVALSFSSRLPHQHDHDPVSQRLPLAIPQLFWLKMEPDHVERDEEDGSDHSDHDDSSSDAEGEASDVSDEEFSEPDSEANLDAWWENLGSKTEEGSESESDDDDEIRYRRVEEKREAQDAYKDMKAKLNLVREGKDEETNSVILEMRALCGQDALDHSFWKSAPREGDARPKMPRRYIGFWKGWVRSQCYARPEGTEHEPKGEEGSRSVYLGDDISPMLTWTTT